MPVSIRLSATNFGPVRSGRVEVKPVTIFIGPNNTGKSFYSTFAHSALAAGISPQGMESAPFHLGDIVASESAEAAHFRETLGEVAAKILDDPDEELTAARAREHQKRVLLAAADQALTRYARRVSIELERCLGGRLSKLRHGSAQKDSPLELTIEEPEIGWRVEITCNRDDPTFRVTPPADLDITRTHFLTLFDEAARINLLSRRSTADHPESAIRRFARLLEALAPLEAERVVFSSFPAMCHYLPAARSGILQGHRTLAAFLVNSASLVGLQRMELPQLSGVVTDFMSKLLQLDRHKERVDPGIDRVSRQLEEEILTGKIEIRTEQGTYPEIFYDVGNLHVPLVRTSSMVSELAPVILFLRYLVNPGDHLIIEEPESHLHPQSQRAFARAFARLRNHGVSLLLTTHSDYLLTEINNLIRSAALAERSDAKPHVSLPASDVGAYLFSPDEGGTGTSVKALRVTEAEGVPDEEFGKVAEAVYDEATDLRYRLIEAGGTDGEELNSGWSTPPAANLNAAWTRAAASSSRPRHEN